MNNKSLKTDQLEKTGGRGAKLVTFLNITQPENFTGWKQQPNKITDHSIYTFTDCY